MFIFAVVVLLLNSANLTFCTRIIDLYGCRYTNICPLRSVCIEDFLFGHCGTPEERFDFSFDLDPIEIKELQLLLNNLRELNVKWADYTTQLVINDFLFSLRRFGLTAASVDFNDQDDSIAKIRLKQLKEASGYGEEEKAVESSHEKEKQSYKELEADPQEELFDNLESLSSLKHLRGVGDTQSYDALKRDSDEVEESKEDGLDPQPEYYVIYEYEPDEKVFYYYYYPMDDNASDEEAQIEDPELGLDYPESFEAEEAEANNDLKRETNKNKVKNEDASKSGQVEYPSVDGVDEGGERTIADLEKEYSEYVDSKYEHGVESDELKPAEHFSISKSPSATKKEPESLSLEEDAESDDDARVVPKREQLTLFNGDADTDIGLTAKMDQLTVPAVNPNFCFVQTEKPITYEQGNQLVLEIMNLTGLDLESYNYISFDGQKITFYVEPEPSRNATMIARDIMKKKDRIEKDVGIKIESTGIGREDNERIMFTSSLAEEKNDLALVCVALLGCIAGLLCGVLGIVALKNNKRKKGKAAKLNAALNGDNNNFTSIDYQELCREHKAVSKKGSGGDGKAAVATVGAGGVVGGASDRGGSVSSEQSTDRASVSSWNEEPCGGNLDISTGHIVLAYMESHLHDKSQLDAEWEALCAYEPEEVSFSKATSVANHEKNRFPTSLPFDHNCITLNSDISQGYGDYINASAIRDTHPEKAAYILCQAPMENTVSDYWQMVWEQRCTVAVLFAGAFDSAGLSTSDGLPQFWPAEGNAVYHNFEVHLVSEHVWCEEYLVRSLYLKNLITSQTRTVTLFHYVAWMPQRCPETGPRPLLEFRRKVNKAYKGKCSPIIVMCGSGCDQSACYVLVDLVLNKIYRGAKEIDISATLEHLRDQRCGAVATKEQFEFCLSAVAEEVNGILKAIDSSAN